MNKKEIVRAIAQKADVSQLQAAKLLDTVFDVIAEALAENGEAKLKGFGSFYVKTLKARKGHNPLTGEAIDIAESRTIRLEPSSLLRKQINKR